MEPAMRLVTVSSCMVHRRFPKHTPRLETPMIATARPAPRELAKCQPVQGEGNACPKRFGTGKRGLRMM